LHRKRRKRQQSRQSKEGAPVGNLSDKIYREESRTANDYSYTALLHQAKMPEMSVKVKMFFQGKAPF